MRNFAFSAAIGISVAMNRFRRAMILFLLAKKMYYNVEKKSIWCHVGCDGKIFWFRRKFFLERLVVSRGGKKNSWVSKSKLETEILLMTFHRKKRSMMYESYLATLYFFFLLNSV